MAVAQPRGTLIVFEGIDRCGKTTQSTELVKHLNSVGTKAIHLRFPDRTSATGKIIDQYLTNAAEVDDRAIHLLFSANRWEARYQILDALNAGTTVVVDRYAYSGVAFTVAKGFDVEWCKGPDKGLPAPDLVIYLKMAVEDTMKRGLFGTERYEKEHFQHRVKDVFEWELLDKTWAVVDANNDLSNIQSYLRTLARIAINAPKDPICKTLWK